MDLKKLRLKQGLTQQELSTLLNISIKTISDIENNKREVSDLVKSKIKKYFKINEI